MAYITKQTFSFLRDLEKNNSREWFTENKGRYEADLKDPLLLFIADFGARLDRISKHMVADPRPSGGSLFRIYRDVRFSKDKTPYKTNAGIQFRHEAGKDAHAPGYYLHIAPGEVFMGAGIWHPETKTAYRIRKAIDADAKKWKRAISGLGGALSLVGDSLKRPPQGFDADHPLIEELKKKDFIVSVELTESAVIQPSFMDTFEDLCKESSKFMAFLCSALDLPF